MFSPFFCHLLQKKMPDKRANAREFQIQGYNLMTYKLVYHNSEKLQIDFIETYFDTLTNANRVWYVRKTPTDAWHVADYRQLYKLLRDFLRKHKQPNGMLACWRLLWACKAALKYTHEIKAKDTQK